MRDSLVRRMPAASGIGFVALIATDAIIRQVKHFPGFGNVAGASNEIFGTTMLLMGVGGALLVVFGATFAAHIRRAVEGGERLAAAIATSSAVIFGLLALAVSVEYMARATHLPALVALGNGIVDGPALFFPAAVLVGAAGMAMLREHDVPMYKSLVAVTSILLGASFIAGVGLMLFKNYAWINDTGYISFLAFTLVVSGIGIIDWAEIRTGYERPAEEAAPAAAPARRTPARRAPARVKRAS